MLPTLRSCPHVRHLPWIDRLIERLAEGHYVPARELSRVLSRHHRHDFETIDVLQSGQLSHPGEDTPHVILHGDLRNLDDVREHLLPEVRLSVPVNRHSSIDVHEVVVASDTVFVNLDEVLSSFKCKVSNN